MILGTFLQWLNRGSRVTLLNVQWRPWPTVQTYFGSPGSGSVAQHNLGWALFAVGAALDAIAIAVLLRRRAIARGVTGEAPGNT
jgi:hypothetical protein